MSAVRVLRHDSAPQPRAGVAQVVRLRPAQRPVPVSALQGTLALTLDTSPRPEPELSSRHQVEELARRLCSSVVETLGGDRSVQQLRRWTTPEVYADLARRTATLSATVGRDQRVRTLRAQVGSIHISWPASRAAEVCVRVRHGQRSRAMAARIELVEGRWVCSALQFG